MITWRAWLRSRLRSCSSSVELWFFRQAEQREIQGVRVAVSSDETDAVFERIERALNRLCFYGKRTLAGLRNDTDGVWIWGASGRGEWRRDLSLVVLDETYVRDPQTDFRQIASTLVHEATHARLARIGFPYTADRRAQIERACFRRQLAFARRLPDADNLIAAAQAQLARPPDWLTPQAMRTRQLEKVREQLEKLRELGFPRPLVGILDRLVKRKLTRLDGGG